MDLKNSTILITEGTSGLGLEFVKQLIQIGANVIVTGRKLEVGLPVEKLPSIY